MICSVGGAEISPEGGRNVFWRLYGSGASNRGLDTTVHVDVIPSAPDRFIMYSTV